MLTIIANIAVIILHTYETGLVSQSGFSFRLQQHQVIIIATMAVKTITPR